MMGNLSALGGKRRLVVAVLLGCFGWGAVQDSMTSAADGVLAPDELSNPALSRSFIRGDVNRDEVLTVMDGIVILQALFEGGTDLTCPDAADVNDDGDVDVADPIALFRYLFAGGLSPPAPCSCAGPDPTPDRLGCE